VLIAGRSGQLAIATAVGEAQFVVVNHITRTSVPSITLVWSMTATVEIVPGDGLRRASQANDLDSLEARHGMRSSRLPFGRLLGRDWFKCYRYFSVEEARSLQPLRFPSLGWRGAYAICA
jgi:hypothetical protein